MFGLCPASERGRESSQLDRFLEVSTALLLFLGPGVVGVDLLGPPEGLGS